ncbi:MAG: sialidase family protein [Armatimonadota bacterium]
MIFCVQSTDEGRRWRDLGQIAVDPEPGTDMGDGALLRLRGGHLLYCYRHNHYRGTREKTPDYAIRIAVSMDNGRHWESHSIVTSHTLPDKNGPSQGLWAPFLFETPDGDLKCCYDDEKTPLEAGFPGHQWLMLRTWEPRSRTWRGPTVVSRAHDPKHLSRDGMGTIVALSINRLLCALESVQVTPPHANLVRFVMSEDGGKTWSWQRGGRGVLYQPKKRDCMALSPYLTRLMDGTLACVFCTDEDREKPDRSGTPPHQLNMDVKMITSRNRGNSWSPPQTITDSHRAYLPGIVENRDGTLLAAWTDFAKGQVMGKLGKRQR